MNSIAIRCEGIGKRYRMGQRQPYRTLREALTRVWRAPFGDRKQEFLWALREISLEVRHGEVLGIIGRNGSGKSTLLKILSRITKPTEGRAEIRGRVGALLEVGTGFHPELTGRENIYLNGAVLGMRRHEIQRRFDEIVEFSECSRFLDMPVKHYSSGMYMRLAFSVAAHLETDILLVDEVLAVGDAAFQKKCLGKIGDAAHQGRTSLFVSHNLVAVSSLCTRAICLHDGQMVLEGAPAEVTSRYLQEWIPASAEVSYQDIESAPQDEMVRLQRACVRPVGGSSADIITIRTPFVLEFEYWKLVPHINLELAVSIYNESGVLLFTTDMFTAPTAPAGLLRSWFAVPGDFLNNGTHRVELSFCRERQQGLTVMNLLAFDVQDTGDLRGWYHGEWPGALRPHFEWTTEQIDVS
jgi:lipopolysaccharide transport system ATP-binding protein